VVGLGPGQILDTRLRVFQSSSSGELSSRRESRVSDDFGAF
jgi:hypothetical protein